MGIIDDHGIVKIRLLTSGQRRGKRLRITAYSTWRVRKYSHLDSDSVKHIFLPRMKNTRIKSQEEICHIHKDKGKLRFNRWVLPPVNHRPNRALATAKFAEVA